MKRFRRPSPSMVVALLALFVAMGGTGYAALKLPKNSVGAKQLKKNAVTSAKVKNRSLLARDFRAGQLPAGPQGPKGEPGTNGMNGPNGGAGPRGPSDAFARPIEFNYNPGSAAATRDLPAGKYVIFAKV